MDLLTEPPSPSPRPSQ